MSEEKLPPSAADPLLEKLKNVFLDKHSPINDNGTAPLYMTTKELYQLFFNFYPTENITMDLLAAWLHEKGFDFVKTGSNYEWQLFT